MSAIIEVEQLGKMYRIGRSESVVRYRSLRDNVTRAVRHPVRFTKRHILRDEEFWALKEVSFAVEPASTLAIVGPNGSGKSTLLKILSRIVDPTEGEVRLRGRVASLLEVGTGFHPELTGRDNVFLNGALLGMSRREIRSKFDQIVEFAGVQRFLDTPVKHYSSGMYVRLAFSVAAHLEPEILIVDEVLAVGDAEFQKRSLGKMEEVTRTSGRTVLFVSHNMAAVESLCTSGILLTQGRVQAAGGIHDVVAAYAQHVRPVTSADLEARRDRRGSGRAVFTNCSVLGDAPDDARTIRLKLAYRNEANESIRDVKVSVLLRDALGTNLVNLTNQVLDQRIDLAANAGTILLDVYGVNLESGVYSLDVFLATDSANSEILDWVENAIAIEVDNDRFYPTHRMPPTRGIALLDFRYSAE